MVWDEGADKKASWLDGVKEYFGGVERQEEVIAGCLSRMSKQDVKAGIRNMVN